eukprot:1186214-Prorocentrum_minimum.AAC.1
MTIRACNLYPPVGKRVRLGIGQRSQEAGGKFAPGAANSHREPLAERIHPEESRSHTGSGEFTRKSGEFTPAAANSHRQRRIHPEERRIHPEERRIHTGSGEIAIDAGRRMIRAGGVPGDGAVGGEQH